MIQQIGDEGFMILRYPEPVGWIVCWKQGIEETMEFASAYETNIANLHGSIGIPRTRPPQGMSVRRILDGKLLAEDVVVGHRESKAQGNLLMPWR